MSSPLQLARTECANWHKGRCLGIPVRCLQSTEPPVAAPLDRCKLAAPKGMCGYFETVVLPLAQSVSKYARAAARYKRRIPKGQTPPAAIVDIWECDCGQPMPKGRRMCDACARRNKLETKKRWKANRRSVVVDS